MSLQVAVDTALLNVFSGANITINSHVGGFPGGLHISLFL